MKFHFPAFTLVASCVWSGFTTAAVQPQFDFNQQAKSPSDTLVLLVTEQDLATKNHALLQDGRVQTIIKSEQFQAQSGKQLLILQPNSDLKRLLLVGVDAKTLNEENLSKTGAEILAQLDKSNADKVQIDTRTLNQRDGLTAAELAYGMTLRAYRFEQYKSNAKPARALPLEILVNNESQTDAAHQKLQAIAEGVYLARDLTNHPAQALTPQTFAEAAKELSDLGAKITVLDEEKLQKLGLNAIYTVGRGSARPPRLVIAHWQGSQQAPLAIVGKGITFDTGGYNLKTDGDSIFRMTSDMAGAAAALGTIKALATQKAPVNVVALMAMAENMISDDAFLPGDVIKTAQGLTVQITSTDAEGRLVMADALWYAREHYKPRAMVDIATLTGSKVGALGSYYAGLFSNHDALIQTLTVAGNKVDEPLWRLPLGPQFAGELKSDIADMRNTGKTTGASTAAWFLQQFTGDTPWAHIDIAGNALQSSDQGVTPTGASGFGVRLLTEWALTQK